MALRLATRMLVPDGRLFALTVAETRFAAHAGMDAPAWTEEIKRNARAAAARAQAELPARHGEVEVVTGDAVRTLLAAVARIDADLLVVGSHGTSRATGIALGSVATRMIHDAPCSVLAGHGDVAAETFPRSIVVGVDTSAQAAEAEAVAFALGAAYDVRVRPLTATGGRPLPDNAALTADLDSRSPVDALVDASRHNDLIVVGSRGLHGMRSLGSVAERVAHRAMCPVLIVRGEPRVAFPPPSSLSRSISV